MRSSANCLQVMSPESASFGSEEFEEKKKTSGGAVFEGSELYQTSSPASSWRQQELLGHVKHLSLRLNRQHCRCIVGKCQFFVFGVFFGGGSKDVWKQENHLIDYLALISIFPSPCVIELRLFGEGLKKMKPVIPMISTTVFSPHVALVLTIASSFS